MTLASIPFAESSLAGVGFAGVAAPGGSSGIGSTTVSIDPFTIEISGLSYKPLVDSLSIDIELGRQGTARFTLINSSTIIRIGEPVRIKFYEYILFVGAVDRMTAQSNNTQTYKTYDIECTDNSYLLFRKKVNRSFSNVSLSEICSSLLADELLNDGITIGVVDNFPRIPVIKADKVTCFDLLNDAAVSVGAIFSIDNDRKLNFIGASMTQSSLSLDENTIESCSQQFDRETFRDVQTVTASGTPANQSDAATTVTYRASNDDLIAQQFFIEGTSGIYSDYEGITHPTSNNTTDVTKLAIAHARILLAVRGSIRETITVSTRQYGFAVGQLIAVTVPHLGIDGNWIIQRLSMRDESGRWLINSMDLSTASLRRRAQELWLDVVRKGSTVILPPTAITTNITNYNAPGTYVFTVPANTTSVVVSCSGAGGGGGGGAYHQYFFLQAAAANGGSGGRGGLAISVLSVTPGEQLTIVVPSGGAGGASQATVNIATNAVGTKGGKGGDATVSRVGGTVCLGQGGNGGDAATANALTNLEINGGIKGSDGSGLFGVAITAGGGANGGTFGVANPLQDGGNGANGRVLVEW